MTQPPPPSDLGAIELTLQGSMMTSNVVPPTVTVNGYPVKTKYGANTIPMPPGRHRVDVSAQWLRTYGQAAIDVDVAAGHASRVFYAMPWHQFTTGSIGFEPQKKKGLGIMLGAFTAIIVVAVAVFALAL